MAQPKLICVWFGTHNMEGSPELLLVEGKLLTGIGPRQTAFELPEVMTAEQAADIVGVEDCFGLTNDSNVYLVDDPSGFTCVLVDAHHYAVVMAAQA